jgi:hypothetical protein
MASAAPGQRASIYLRARQGRKIQKALLRKFMGRITVLQDRERYCNKRRNGNMTKKTFNTRSTKLRITTALIVALSLPTLHLGLIPAVSAQTPSKPSASSSEGGPKEGIKVHGHWTIEVRNPDGKLVERREFENSLRGQGARALAGFLSRTATPGLWLVVLFAGPPQGTPPCALGPQPSPCTIAEPAWPLPPAVDPATPPIFRNLTVSASEFTVMLNGTATAGASGGGVITDVTTFLGVCSNSVAPGALDSTCLNAKDGGAFSHAMLASPVNVAAGQIIQVSVVFSFS